TPPALRPLPYTTLFRSGGEERRGEGEEKDGEQCALHTRDCIAEGGLKTDREASGGPVWTGSACRSTCGRETGDSCDRRALRLGRSEEHTSELQSPDQLV